MNIQTYQNCIRTLQNEIKSREQQRQSMQNTITALDRDLGIEIDRNKTLRDELMYLANTNQNIINELHSLQQLIKEKDTVIESKIAADEGRGLYIQALERDKTVLGEQIRQKNAIITQKNVQLVSQSTQLNNALSSIKGYESNLQQKSLQITQLLTELRTNKQQCASINQKLVNTLKQQQLQRQQFTEKLMRSQGSASSITQDLQQKIKKLQQQLQQAKSFYDDQVATLQFNKQQQVAQLNKQVKSLEFKVSSFEGEITHLREEEKKLKSHYDVQIENNDKVVNTLINEINFLKEEKVELKRRSSKQIQDTAHQVLMMGLEMADKQAKAKATQNQIKGLKQEIYRKDKEISNLNKEIQKLNFQIQIATKEHSGQKDTVLKKNEEIAQLKRFIDNLKKFAQVADKDKQAIAKKTSIQIDNLKSQNQQLTQKLQTAMSELEQLRITSAELQQSVKFLSIQKASTSSNVTQLQTLIKTHQYTIQKLQLMLEQTKKVVVDLNKLMKTKLAQIQSLQMSNNLFRKEKLQWIKKQQDYRKRIAQYKAIGSAARKLNLNETSFMSRAARRSVSQKDNKQRTHSMVLGNIINGDKELAAMGSGFNINAIRRKTMMTGNFSQNKTKSLSGENHNSGNSQGESGNESNQGIVTIPLVQNAFKKPETKTKKKSVDFTSLPVETPVIPVLIAMKKLQDKINLSFEGQNSIDKQNGAQQDRIGWEGLSENVIEALTLNASLRNPLSDRQSLSNRESIAQTIEQNENNLDEQKQIEEPSQQSRQAQTVAMVQVVLEQGDKQVSTQTHPQTPTTNYQNQPQLTIQPRSQNLTPQFHIQSEQPDQTTKQDLNKPHEPQQQANLQQGYQTLEEYEQQQRRAIEKKISPINSRVIINKQDQLVEILEDQELTQITEINEVSQLNALKQKDQAESLQNHEVDQHDSVEAQHTVDSINILLDRINTQ